MSDTASNWRGIRSSAALGFPGAVAVVPLRFEANETMCGGSAGTIPAAIMLIAIVLVEAGGAAPLLVAGYSAQFEANGGGSRTAGRGRAEPPISYGRDGHAIEDASGA